MRAALIRAAGLAISGALALAGCGGDGGGSGNIVLLGDGGSLSSNAGETSYPAQLVRAATAQGLVAFDAEGRVIPALADRWIVLDEGQSYIFRLRDGTWRDGSPLTARSARIALREALAALRKSSLGLDLAVIDDIRVMAGRVIEIRLRQPMPDLLQLLAQPELGLVYRGQSAGPMRLAHTPHGAVLSPIDPQRLGLPAVRNWERRARPLNLVAMDGEAAVQRFSRGEADLLLGGRVQQFPLAGTLGISRGTIQVDPVAGVFGLAVINGEGLLGDAANREALAMAIDRDALIQSFGVAGWAATTRVVPANVGGDAGLSGERWSELPLAERQRRARERLEQWRATKAREQGMEVLRIGLPDGPGADVILDRLRQDFGAIGLGVARVRSGQRPDLALVDEVARYPSAAWFLNQFNCRVQRGLCDVGADALMDQVRIAAEATTRSRLLREAVASLTAANVYIPLGAPLRWSLVRGDLIGFAPNRIGLHPLMPIALRPR